MMNIFREKSSKSILMTFVLQLTCLGFIGFLKLSSVELKLFWTQGVFYSGTGDLCLVHAGRGSVAKLLERRPLPFGARLPMTEGLRRAADRFGVCSILCVSHE